MICTFIYYNTSLNGYSDKPTATMAQVIGLSTWASLLFAREKYDLLAAQV